MNASRFSIATPAGEALSVVLLLPSLLAIAIWTGFPVIFYDTAAYMVQGLGHVFMPERSSVYSLFLAIAGARVSLWIVASVQCVIIAFLMTEFARAVRPKMPAWMLAAIGAALAIVTGMPWYAAQIEPDCFTVAAVIGLYLLLFHDLGAWRNILIVLATALSIAVHASHVGVAAGLLIASALLGAFRHRLGPDCPAPRFAPAIASFMLAIIMILACNYALTGEVFFSRAGSVFLMARMMEDGLVEPVLHETCPQSGYVLCRYKDKLPANADDWLWNTSTSPFARLGGFKGLEAESASIVSQSIRREPIANLAAALRDAAVQFVEFQTGDGLVKQKWVPVPKYRIAIPLKAEASAAGVRKSEAAFLPLNFLHVSVGLLSLAALCWLLWDARRNRDWRRGTLIGFVLLALAGNAFICGVFSGPHGRYQSRIMWLATFTVVLAARPGAFSLRQRGESGT